MVGLGAKRKRADYGTRMKGFRGARACGGKLLKFFWAGFCSQKAAFFDGAPEIYAGLMRGLAQLLGRELGRGGAMPEWHCTLRLLFDNS